MQHNGAATDIEGQRTVPKLYTQAQNRAVAKPSRVRRGRKRFNEDTIALIRDLVSKGVRAAEIANELGTSVGSLRVTCCRRGIALRPTHPPGHPENLVSVRVPIETYRDYLAAAERRAQSAKQLISALLATIARDDLFSAVLDEPQLAIPEEAEGGEGAGGERSKRSA